MKNLLKLAVVLLLLFAMVGTASAAVDSISIGTPTLNGTDYDVDVSWSGTLETDVFNITITPGGFSKTSTTNDGSVTFTEAFIPGTPYTVRVEDDTSYQEDIFTIPAAPATLPQPSISNFKSTADSTDTQFNVTWDWTQTNDETLQITANGTWTDVTGNTAMVDGNTSGDTDILIRAKNGTGPDFLYSDPVPLDPFEIVSYSTENTTNSITWTLGNWTGCDEDNITVTGDISNEVDADNISVSGNKITASNLNSGENYTIEARGTEEGNFSLFFTNKFELKAAAADFVDDDNTTSNKQIFKDNDSSKGTQNFDTETGVTFYINMTATQTVEFKWELKKYDEENDSWETFDPVPDYNISNNTTTNSSNFSWRPSETGKFQLNLAMNDTSVTPNPTQTFSWEVTVTPRSTGSRIWEEGMPTTYTWDARSFSGFYYDMDNGQGSEYMRIENIGRTIAKGDLFYTTTTSNVTFEYESWGDYQIVGFMGDKYYAGHGSDSIMKEGYLSKVLMDSDEGENFHLGQTYALEEGYSLVIDQIDVNGRSALISLQKDGKQVGQGIVNTEGSDRGNYTFEKNITSKVKVPLVRIHVSNVFMGTESSLVTIDGIFQVSDNLTKLESGTEIDKMEIDSVTNDTINMTNSERISLSQDSNVTLMGKMQFIVADNSKLRFAPTIEYTDPGVYEIRGTVSDYSVDDYIIYEWTPLNFEGFYYDINDDISVAEKIKINQDLSSSRTIDKGNLEYTSNVTVVDYNYSGWGEYTVVGFMGEKYYAGVDGSLLKDGNLSKVLVDDDEGRRLNLGGEITLEEGVSIKASQIDVNGNSTLLEVMKDGKSVETFIVRSGGDMIYNGSGKLNNTTFIRVHVDQVFMGTESSLVSINGVFQASQNLTKLESDTKYGKMNVDSYSAQGIILSNDERISLSQDNDVEFMKVGNNSMYFKVGDNSTLRFAPVVERQIGSSDPLDVTLNPSNATVGDSVKITVNDRGVTIEGVTVYVNGSKIGTTDSDGIVNFTTNATGSFRVTAEKSGFVNGSATLNVVEKLINMTVRVSPETVYFGTVGTIKATDSLNGSAISDATVYISGESIGRTNSSGELNYTFNKTGNVTIDVSKEKYNNGTTSINVSQEVAFAYSNFALKPDSPSAKKAIKLTFDVTNNGIKDGSHDVSLILKDSSGNVVDQANSTVSANMGKSKSVSLSVKAPEEGTYTLTLIETDSNRTIDLPSSMATVPVGEAKFGSTILYIVLAFLAIIVIAVVGFVAYLFGVKGATKDNYQMVAQEVIDDIKSKFQRK